LRTVAQVRVLLADTDAMGIVYHANYLRWFELGRCELVRGAGLPYAEMEAMGYFLPVIEAHARYRAPARYDDVLSVSAAVEDLAGASVSFRYRIVREADGTLLCEGRTFHACTDRQGKVRRFPEAVLAPLRIARGDRFTAAGSCGRPQRKACRERRRAPGPGDRSEPGP
jgi:acyl-CoA thioester hydrolase